jgi:hypothetical protein
MATGRNGKFQRHNWESNPRLSGLLRSAVNNCATSCPCHKVYEREICHAFKDLSLVAQFNNPEVSLMIDLGISFLMGDIT